MAFRKYHVKDLFENRLTFTKKLSLLDSPSRMIRFSPPQKQGGRVVPHRLPLTILKSIVLNIVKSILYAHL